MKMPENITELGSMPESTQVLNNSENNVTLKNEPATPVADAGVSEDTTGADILKAKDSIITAYETQVAKLQEQINTLMRNGAVINDGTKADPEPAEPQVDDDYISFSELGKFIGSKEDK